MSKGKNIKEYSEIDDIKDDLQSLKSNTVALTRHLKEDGVDHLADLESRAAKAGKKFKAEGKRRYKEIEDGVRANPGQALLAAFAGGLVVSMLLSRRS